MTSFSKDEVVKIVLFYGKFENYQKVRNEYAKFYGISKHPRDLPDVRMFKSVIDRFLGTGSVHKKGAGGRPKAARTEENEERVKKLVESKNSISIRQIAFHLDLQETSIWRLLRKVVMVGNSIMYEKFNIDLLRISKRNRTNPKRSPS